MSGGYAQTSSSPPGQEQNTIVAHLGRGMALPSLIGAALSHVPPERAGAAAGILTTTQQFGAASGVAVIGAVFYGRIGDVPSRGGSVSAMVLAMVIDAAIAQERAAEYTTEAVH